MEVRLIYYQGRNNNMIEQILDTFKNNEFFQGGFLVAVMSGLLFYIKSIPNKLLNIFDRYTTLSINIPDSNHHFTWISQYVNQIYRDSIYGRFTIINRNGIEHTSIGDTRYHRVSKFCWIKFMFTERELENKTAGEDAFAYSISLKLYGFGKRKQLGSFLDKCCAEFGPSPSQKSIKSWSTNNHWQYLKQVPDRTLDTVYSDSLENVRQDILSFQEKRQTYKSKGIPFRRGYLFYGPPGTGKTSSVSVLANDLGMDIHTIKLNNISGDSLIRALSRDNKLIVFEDIDSVLATATRQKSEEQKSDDTEGFSLLDLSDLLNAIDGTLTGDNLIFIFTTNHPEKLDPALMRPGRIDRKVLFGYLNQSEFEKMTNVYFGKGCDGCLVRDDLTAAEAQNHYLTYGDYGSFLNFCCEGLDAKPTSLRSTTEESSTSKFS